MSGESQEQQRDGSKEIRAAVLIQKMMRGIRGRVEYRRKRLWQCWNLLDTEEERKLSETHAEYEDIKRVYAEVRRAHEKVAAVVGEEASDGGAGDAEQGDEHPAPRMPRGDGEVTLDLVTACLDHFKEGGLLRRADVIRVIRRAQFLHTSMPNVVDVRFATRLTVVGDLHGQLDDLFSIFKLNGLPSPRNWYLFNGDFVDRGQHSVECVLTLYLFKILYPSSVFLNRGNHEARDVNSRDGFERECVTKYDAGVFDAFSESFAALPLAAVLNERVFVVHGGLFWDDLSLADVRALDRFHEIPPSGGAQEQMLWSDPDEEEGRSHNPRGTSCVFGPDVCNAFLRGNRLSMVVRSHECMEDGFEVRFGGRLLTVFSASNYCGVAGNLGAFLVFDAALRYQIVQYSARPKESMGRYRLPHSAIEDDVISRLLRRIAENRVALSNHYFGLDTHGDGTVSRLEWAEGLRAVLGVNIPWLEFSAFLGVPKLGTRGQEDGRIDYHAFLERYRLHLRRQGASAGGGGGVDDDDGGDGDGDGDGEQDKLQRAMDKISVVLYRNRLQLAAMFRCFDVDGSGDLSRSEFADGLLSLGSLMPEPVTAEEIELLARHVDADGDGSISYQEFFDGFKLEDSRLTRVLERSAAARESRRDGVNFRGEEHEHTVALVSEAPGQGDDEKP